MSKIEWCDASWSPITGCTWESPACDNCYARKMAKRLKAMGQEKYKNGFNVSHHYEELNKDFGRKSKKIFVCSMSDLFHSYVDEIFIYKVFQKIFKEHNHIFQILTKRPERASVILNSNFTVDLPENVWFGITTENQEQFDRRKNYLYKIPAQVKFLSIEPMLSEIELDHFTLTHIDWVIVGGETGPKARYMNPGWARSIRDQCKEYGIPFFFKQMSKKAPIPEDLNIKQFPERLTK